jgi:trimeric autotransporter adhesin
VKSNAKNDKTSTYLERSFFVHFPSPAQNASFTGLRFFARPIIFLPLICLPAPLQGQGLSIANYQLVSQQTIQRIVNVTFRADLVNTGAALGAAAATVTSLNPSIQVAPGQDTLQFASVPANSQVTSSNTFTLQVSSTPVDFTQLQWSFQTGGILLPASVTVTPGGEVTIPVALGSPAPSGGVFITLASSNPSAATVWPGSVFVPQGSTTAVRGVTSVTGGSAGSAAITASAPGYGTASVQVQVSSGGGTATTMSFWPGSLTVSQGTMQNLTLNLSAPAPAGMVVSLSSSDTTVATVPPTVSFGTGGTSLSVPVTGLAAGSVTITASAPSMASTTASVTVTPQTTSAAAILLPASVTVTSGNSVSLPIALGTAAPSGGVTVTLTSNNTSTATVWPASVYISEGATTPRAQAAVGGYSNGTAIIMASAPGYTTATAQAQVTGGGPPPNTAMSFSTANVTINGIVTQNLTLNLSAPAAAALAVNLGTSDPKVATVPATVTFAAGAGGVSVPVTSVAAGSVIITASAPGVGSATASVTVTQAAAGGIVVPASVTVPVGSPVSFPVTLGAAAPAGGVSITLASSNSSIATVWPNTIFIPDGATSARVAITVSGIGVGSASISASAFGFPTASGQVQVTSGTTGPNPTMTFSPASLTINGTGTQNLQLNLSLAAPAVLAVTLSSSNSSVATVPATVSFATGATSVTVPVTALAVGSATITASLTNLANATASVTVASAAGGGGGGAITFAYSPTVGVNQSAAVAVSLTAAAPAGGVTVTFTSSNASIATVTSSVFIAAGSTFPITQPQVSGVNVGSATITASAPGFTSGSVQAQVTAGGGSSYFVPVGGLTINVGAPQSLSLILSSAAASAITVNLTSSDPTVATVPATATGTPGSALVNVPVTGVAAGTVTITANSAAYGTATTSVTVNSLAGVSVTWYGACWANLTINGFTGNFQAMDFSLSTPVPQAFNGSLFFSANCAPTGGIDNLNDTGLTFGSTHRIQGFIHFPNLIPSSAMYWIGNASSFDGTCPAGSLCSGCVNYTAATPSCSILP